MTPKQREFARHYANEPVVLKAALAAGYSDNYARTHGKILLGNEEIVAEIQRIRKRVNERADKSAVDVVNEYSKIAFTDRVGFLKDDPLRPGEYMYKAPDELTDDQRSVVERVNMTVRKVEGKDDKGKDITVHRQEYRYVLSDKSNALQQMGRHFGIFDDKLRITSSHQNPFKNATPKQLEQLKKSWVKTMNDPAMLEGEYEVVNGKEK